MRSTLSQALGLTASLLLAGAATAQSCPSPWQWGTQRPGLPGQPSTGTGMLVWGTASWDPDGPGPLGETPVVGRDSGLSNAVFRWEARRWIQVGQALRETDHLINFNGQLLVAGWVRYPERVCNDVEFNNDGSAFDLDDIDSFLSVFSEGPCL